MTRLRVVPKPPCESRPSWGDDGPVEFRPGDGWKLLAILAAYVTAVGGLILLGWWLL